jgi:hypothetical protein
MDLAAFPSGALPGGVDVVHRALQDRAQRVGVPGVAGQRGRWDGVDVGGFRREVLLPGHLDELYTQWFANSAWFDVPLRPHVDNSAFYTERAEGTLDSPLRNRVAPSEVGHVASNLENLRTRYRLIPYCYSLAHLAAQTGSPLMPPPGIVYPDPDLRGIAHQKLVGPNLMVAVVAGHGEYSRRVYLPAGTWYDFYSGERYVSTGEWFAFVPEYRDGLFRLPAFARAGGIIPMMYVDADTLDSAGHRPDGSTYEDLILRVFDDPDAASSFTVVEDDGASTTSPSRQIHVDLRRAGQQILVSVDAAAGVPALADVRPLTVEVVSAFATSAVTVNGTALPQVPDVTRSQRGWTTVDTRTVRACVPDAAVTQQHTFAFHLSGPAPATASLLLVCDRAFTDWGEDVYARFLQPVHTARGPLTELELDPSLTYPYMYPQPPDATTQLPDVDPPPRRDREDDPLIEHTLADPPARVSNQLGREGSGAGRSGRSGSFLIWCEPTCPLVCHQFVDESSHRVSRPSMVLGVLSCAARVCIRSESSHAVSTRRW